MPKILYFPYFGPNRRDDRRLVEVRIDYSGDQAEPRSIDESDLRGDLEAGKIIAQGAPFPTGILPQDPRARFASLLGDLAVLFQFQAGHEVELIAVRPRERGDQWLVLVEYLHCDVGMTAVKLAVEVVQGQRRQLAEPFARFARFARERRVPAETRAIMAAARERDIPFLQLEQPPFSGAKVGGHRVRPQGLLMLGHGNRAEILDGSFCLSRADEAGRELLQSADRRAALLADLEIPSCDPARDLERKTLACGDTVWLLPDNSPEVRPAVSTAEREVAGRIQEALGGQAVLVHLRAMESGRPCVIDFEPGPDLAMLESKGAVEDDDALSRSAGSLLDHLFSNPADARIPLIAITGTNGKTTTSRMVDHILRHAGFNPGLVCTDGSYIGGHRISDKDESTIQGHGRVLTHRGIDAAVLETHHRGIAVRGFASWEFDVGICLNVTEEHIKQGEIESLQEMAQVKRAVPERGRNAVLFADDERCRAMIDHLAPECLWLISLERDKDALRALAGPRPFGCCVIETIDEEEFVVLHHETQRTVLFKPQDVPATLGGTARFNLGNAMHAAVAAFAVGVAAEQIAQALRRFEASPEMTPGRMNVFEQLPFRVVMDFAHTPDGIAKISEFADRQKPAGRKVLAFAGAQGREPVVWESMGRAAAGRFDLYFCKENPPRAGEPENQTARHLKRGLEAMGVPGERIRTGTYGQAQAFEIFDACEAGDLLVFLVGHAEKEQLAGFIEAYRQRNAST